MELRVLRVEINCIDNKPQVIVLETGEELEVVFGNFDNAIFVKYQDEEYLVDTAYPCYLGGDGVLHLKC